MIREYAPHDHNDTTETFPRTSSACSNDFKATEVHKFTPWGLYVVYALLVLISVIACVLIAQNKNFPNAEYVPQEAEKAHPCGAGQVAEWEDSFTVKCIKETR